MTIIIFLVDTSASMNQRTYLGTSLLDVAKGAIENFMKYRARDPNARLDRYMLLTFEDPPGNVKAGWKENHATFINELKNLEATGLTNLGTAMKNAFDLLNVNRMQTGIDTYGQGRCPFYLEPAVIITITDGRKMTSTGGVSAELNLPMNHVVPGSELTKEPFRWDQRLFGLVLRLPAVPPSAEMTQGIIPSADDAAVDAMCEVTGGRSYNITTHRMLMNCLESLVQKCQSGVVINFEKIGPDPPPLDDEKDDRSKTPTSLQSVAWHNCRRMIYVPRSVQKGTPVGFWPLPEAFWPDLTSTQLPARNAQPIVKFTCTPTEPLSMENLPFDKYELERSPLTQYILSRHQPSHAWQVFIANSAKYSDIGHPFGFLKASTNLQAVNLFVMPYNYPTLIPLLDELVKVHKYKPTTHWRQKFDNYLKTMPVYYAQPLKRALARMNMHYFVPDNMDNCLSYSVVSYLKKLKNQAKLEYDKMVALVGIKSSHVTAVPVRFSSKTSILERKDLSQLIDLCGVGAAQLKRELTEFDSFSIRVPDTSLPGQPFKNPFDIKRKQLLGQVSRMRRNFLQKTVTRIKLQDEDAVHNQPVQQMGNYQQYLKLQPPPLREVDASPARLHTFGNPFKVNKNLMIDEADEAMPGQQASSRKRSHDVSGGGAMSPRPCKRKPGPLPKHVPASHLMSPVREPLGTDSSYPNLDDVFNTGKSQLLDENDINLTVPANQSLDENDVNIAAPANQSATFPVNSSASFPTNHVDSSRQLSTSQRLLANNNTLTDDVDDSVMIVEPMRNNDTNHVLVSNNKPVSNMASTGATTGAAVHGNNAAAAVRVNSDATAPVRTNQRVNDVRKALVAREFNKQLRVSVVKEVRKPGKNYDQLFSYLQTVRGSLDTRCLFLRDVRREALRFKKRLLAQQIDQLERAMIDSDVTSGGGAVGCGADATGNKRTINTVEQAVKS